MTMEKKFMTTVNSKLKCSEEHVLQTKHYCHSSLKVMTERSGNHIRKDGMASHGERETQANKIFTDVNGETEMDLKTDVRSPLSSIPLQSVAEFDIVGSESDNQYIFKASEPPDSLSSITTDTSNRDGMDVDDTVSSSSSGDTHYTGMHQSSWSAEGSEATDSRDSFGTVGVEMEVDVTTSANQEKHSKVRNSDDAETAASLDSQRSDESMDAITQGAERKLAKSKKVPWIPLYNLSYELEHGYRLLRDLMGDRCKSFNWPFMDPVDVEALGLWDYHDKVKQPMWLRKIQFKFVDSNYESITEFVGDIRILLENCYRYNGMKHWVSKQAQMLESTLQQKLSLLPRSLQEKTTLYMTSKGKYGADGGSTSTASGRRRFTGRYTPNSSDFSPLATAVRKDLEEQSRENKRQQIQTRKEEVAQYYVELLDWEKELMQEDGAKYMGSMWEIPFIGHFLYLSQSALHLDEVSYYELERAFAAPRQSSLLRKIFTSLLCTPYQRTRLEKKPAMPYKVWESKLREFVRYWYSILEEGDGDIEDTSKLLGISPRFFEVLGTHFFMDHKRYHELSFYERVYVMKTLCDYVYETQSNIKKTMDAHPISDQRQMVLGYDRDSNAYLHFPQFCGADLRIYRQTCFPEPVIEQKKRFEETEMPQKSEKSSNPPKAESKVPEPTVAPLLPARTRPSRLRKKINPVLRHGIHSEKEHKDAELSKKEQINKMNGKINANNDCALNAKESRESVDMNMQENDGNLANDAKTCRTDTLNACKVTPPVLTSGNDNNSNNREHMERQMGCRSTTNCCENKLTDNLVNDLKDGSDIPKNNQVIVQEQSSKTEVSDDISGDISANDSKDMLSSANINKDLSIGADSTSQVSSTGDEQTIQTKETFLTSDDNKPPPGTTGEQTVLIGPDKNMKASADSTVVVDEQKSASNKTTSKICWSPPRPSTPLPAREEVLPPLGEFELVCNCMDDLRALVKKFSVETEEIAIPTKGKKGKKKKVTMSKPVRRKPCEIELHEKLCNLLLELEPWEDKLVKAATRTREKLSKEVKYTEQPHPDKVIKDIWASEESSSESESSDSDSDSDSSADSSSCEETDVKTKTPMNDTKEDTKEDTKRPDEDADLTTKAILDSVLENEIPAKRTRLARKRHIHMLKSAAKAATKSVNNNIKRGNVNNSNEVGKTNNEVASKKARVSHQQQQRTSTCQPVHATLGNGPGSLSASLPMHFNLQSSNLLNTNVKYMVPQGNTTLGMPVQSQTTDATKKATNKRAIFVKEAGSNSSSLQPSRVNTAGQSATAVLTKMPTGSNVRYMSIQDLAKINPTLAQTITSMSIQQQSGPSRGGATKPVQQTTSLGTVPGVTCIMKTISNDANQLPKSVAQSPSSTTVVNNSNVSISSGSANPVGCNDIRSSGGGLAATSLFKNNATISLGKSVETTNAMQGLTNPIPQTTHLVHTGAPKLPNCTEIPATAINRAATQIVSSAASRQPVTMTSRNVAVTAQSVLGNTSSVIPSTLAGGTALQQHFKGTVSQSQPLQTIPTSTAATVGQQPSTVKSTFTVTVDAKMWKQLQGQPQLQQQLILNHIRQLQQQQQQKIAQQQQQPANQNKVILSPFKTALQFNNPQHQQLMQQPILQQQSAQQQKLTTVSSNMFAKSNSSHQQVQYHHQPAKQIIKISTSPTKSSAFPMTNSQQVARQHQIVPQTTNMQHIVQQIQTASEAKSQLLPQQLQTANTLHLTHTQQTQPSNLNAAVQLLHHQGQSLTSNVQTRNSLLQGNQKTNVVSVPVSAIPTSDIQKQLKHLPQQQVQNMPLNQSPATSVVLQHAVPVNQTSRVVSVPVSTLSSGGVQQQLLLRQPLGNTITLSPSKRIVLQQNIPGNPKQNTVTIPLSSLLNQQIKQVQQQQLSQQLGKPSLVYALPTTSTAQVTSQGSQSLILNSGLTQLNQASQRISLQSAPLLTPPSQGLPSLKMQSLTSFAPPNQIPHSVQSLPTFIPSLHGQQQANPVTVQSSNLSQLLQQVRGHQNRTVLVSGLPQNQPQGTVQVIAPAMTTLGQSSSMGRLQQPAGNQSLQGNTSSSTTDTMQ